MSKCISTIPLLKHNCYLYLWFILIMLTVRTLIKFPAIPLTVGGWWYAFFNPQGYLPSLAQAWTVGQWLLKLGTVWISSFSPAWVEEYWRSHAQTQAAWVICLWNRYGSLQRHLLLGFVPIVQGREKCPQKSALDHFPLNIGGECKYEDGGSQELGDKNFIKFNDCFTDTNSGNTFLKPSSHYSPLLNNCNNISIINQTGGICSITWAGTC